MLLETCSSDWEGCGKEAYGRRCDGGVAGNKTALACGEQAFYRYYSSVSSERT